jgi:electron transfer flavoprotein alpha subunit
MTDNVWVFVEYRGEELSTGAQELCSEGRRLANKLGNELWALVARTERADATSELGRFGVDQVLITEREHPASCAVEWCTEILGGLIRIYQPSVFLLEWTPFGRSLAPRLATHLNAGYVPECVRFTLDDRRALLMTRPICGGRAYGTFICPHSDPQIATLKPGAFSVQEVDHWQPPETELVSSQPQVEWSTSVVISQETANPRTMDIREAEVIVAAGRGVQEADSLSAVQALADLLEAPLAGSRPLVDMGLIPSERQVGQTGVTVAPKLYVACGISGAAQHTMGMRESETILAIDIRPTAPIFGLADLKVVGDVGPILGALNRLLTQLGVRK